MKKPKRQNFLKNKTVVFELVKYNSEKRFFCAINKKLICYINICTALFRELIKKYPNCIYFFVIISVCPVRIDIIRDKKYDIMVGTFTERGLRFENTANKIIVIRLTKPKNRI